MKMDKSIFGLRNGSNLSIQPTHEEIRAFLESNKKEGGRELHGSVLAQYDAMLEDVLLFRQGERRGAQAGDERDKMFYGALSHSCFFDPALKSAVEQYKYQLHELSTIDFKKPRAFINAAEEAISLLNSRKKADAARIVKIQEMADERKKLLETFATRWPALVEELGHIALYVRDNLLKIANRCETSIAVLVDGYVARTKETQLVEDIKAQIKEQLTSDLQDGRITRQRLESAKKDFDLLSKEMAHNFRENIFALTQLYESIYDHTMKIARRIDTLMAESDWKTKRSLVEDVAFFNRIERVLDSLMSGQRFELKAPDAKSETAHKNMFLEKRKEMLDHLFELMQKDRRSWLRRSREKRRSSDDRQSQHQVQRSGSDRRAGRDRRRADGEATRRR